MIVFEGRRNFNFRIKKSNKLNCEKFEWGRSIYFWDRLWKMRLIKIKEQQMELENRWDLFKPRKGVKEKKYISPIHKLALRSFKK